MKYRVYFHKRDGNDPVVWSVDEGTQDTEIHVQGYVLNGVYAYSESKLDAKAGEPSGWISIPDAHRELNGGCVTFHPRKTGELG